MLILLFVAWLLGAALALTQAEKYLDRAYWARLRHQKRQMWLNYSLAVVCYTLLIPLGSLLKQFLVLLRGL
jgi:hypothetical protein